jgi:hypothetical protein
MRIWQIIIASVIAATIAGGAVAGWAVFALGQYTEAAIVAAVYPAAPLIGSVWLGAYALCALALVTASLSHSLRQAGQEICRSAGAIAADPAELARFLPPALPGFIVKLRDILFSEAPEPQAALALRLSGVPAQVRSACRRLYFSLLVRSQYPTALALLLALAVIRLPAALSAKSEPFHALIAAMPGILLGLAIVMFGLVEHVMRLTGVAPFVRSLTLLPIESQEARLLRQLLGSGQAAPDPSPPSSLDEGRLQALVDAGQQPVLRAVARLADAVEGLDRSARADLDGIKAALIELAEARRLGEDDTVRSQYRKAAEELQGAVSALGDTIVTMNELSSSLGTLTAAPRPTSNGGEPINDAWSSLLRDLELLSREMNADQPRSHNT